MIYFKQKDINSPDRYIEITLRMANLETYEKQLKKLKNKMQESETGKESVWHTPTSVHRTAICDERDSRRSIVIHPTTPRLSDAIRFSVVF